MKIKSLFRNHFECNIILVSSWSQKLNFGFGLTLSLSLGLILILSLRLTRSINWIPFEANIAEAPLHPTNPHSTLRIQQFIAIHRHLTNRFLRRHPLYPNSRFWPPLSHCPHRTIQIQKTHIRRASSTINPNYIIFTATASNIRAAHTHAPTRACIIYMVLDVAMAQTPYCTIHRRRVLYFNGAVE